MDSGPRDADDVLGALAAGRVPGEDPHEGHSHPPTADLSVRPSLPEDAPHITAIQLAAWQERGLVTDEDLAAVDTAAVTNQWRAAVSDPPSSSHRVLTALAGAQVVGFLAFAPAEDTELPESAGTSPVELLALEVAAEHARQGHGSRLLAACADLVRDRQGSALMTWAGQGDEPRTRFLTTAGFAPAGPRRTFTASTGEIVESCWFAQL